MILVVIEHDAGALDRLSSEALTLGGSLADATGSPLHAVAWGPGAASISGGALAGTGAATLHVIDDPRLTDHAPEAIGKGLAQLVEREAPIAVVGSASDRGAEIMAHLGARTGLPLAANCTDVRPGDPWQVTRQRWGGSLLEEARLEGASRLLTAAPHAYEPAAAGAGSPVMVKPFAPDLTERDFRVRITSRVPAEAGKVSLTDARVVVGGGRGVGSAEGFAQLDELAALLGGAVGVSRVVTSAGWRPHAQQVGQTGTRIAPDLYIACGISGAIQHIVGCRSAKAILAINTDRDAPMVTRATYAVIGDLHTVMPAVIGAIKATR
jgi:electron transfer flavoprotein alpha subunit